MCQCEDRPCCGHLAEERADDAYWAERAYTGEGYYSEDEHEVEEEEWCDDCYCPADECYCGGSESWQREDDGHEAAFGDC